MIETTDGANDDVIGQRGGIFNFFTNQSPCVLVASAGLERPVLRLAFETGKIDQKSASGFISSRQESHADVCCVHSFLNVIPRAMRFKLSIYNDAASILILIQRRMEGLQASIC